MPLEKPKRTPDEPESLAERLVEPTATPPETPKPDERLEILYQMAEAVDFFQKNKSYVVGLILSISTGLSGYYAIKSAFEKQDLKNENTLLKVEINNLKTLLEVEKRLNQTGSKPSSIPSAQNNNFQNQLQNQQQKLQGLNNKDR